MCNKMVEISAEELIRLVEERRFIWDKNATLYKVTVLKAIAWREICCFFNPKFDELEDNERIEFQKGVVTKWINIRDAFLRSQRAEKKQQTLRRSSSAKKPRPYIYKNLLGFLTKDNEAPTRPDSCNESQSSLESSDNEANPEKQFQPSPTKKKLRIEKMTLEEKMTRFLESTGSDVEEHPQISFMKGMLPALASFDDDENLEFQAGVVALIQSIRRKRQGQREYESSSSKLDSSTDGLNFVTFSNM